MLDEHQIDYGNASDINQLYRLVSKELNLAPSQHTEQTFKQILGGCSSIIEGLGSLRNKVGDAHGQGKTNFKPAPRHAELAVNLAGSISVFLFATWSLKEK
ncbi:abortive infection family protein [Acinetobacter sp. YH16032]|uniref:abortive infection family protein n=1 Tax=Acinetobacter sp. YH16032 TaxID=2601181 RepID=UPI0035A06B02